MGKGGEKTASAPAPSEGTASAPVKTINVSAAPTKMKLEHLHTEELKKWAKAYGIDAEADRDQLLSSLVRRSYYKTSSLPSSLQLLKWRPTFPSLHC